MEHLVVYAPWIQKEAKTSRLRSAISLRVAFQPFLSLILLLLRLALLPAKFNVLAWDRSDARQVPASGGGHAMDHPSTADVVCLLA